MHERNVKNPKYFCMGLQNYPSSLSQSLVVLLLTGKSFGDNKIDKSSLPPITKFTYLLELLEPDVKRGVESFPFSPEGYNRAKGFWKTNTERNQTLRNVTLRKFRICQTLQEPILVRSLTFVINSHTSFKYSRQWGNLSTY